LVQDSKKTKNADRSPYATENDRRMNLKGLARILRNLGRSSACLKISDFIEKVKLFSVLAENMNMITSLF